MAVALLLAAAGPAPARLNLNAIAPATRYIVILNPGAATGSVLRTHGLEPLYELHEIFEGFIVDLDRSAVARLTRDPRVEAVAADEVIQIPPLPNRQQIRELLEGLGVPVPDAYDDLPVFFFEPYVPHDVPVQVVPTGVSRIGGLESVTASIDGIDEPLDIDIAVLDTGVDLDHPDLNVVGGYDCTLFGGGTGDDENGHGTHVAGTAAALDNGFGVVGVAPGARVWSVKTYTSLGVGLLSWVVCAFEWVAAHADVIDVANASFGENWADDRNCGRTIPDLIHRAVCAATDRGVAIAAGAGNSAMDSTVWVPAAYAEVIGVSGLADSDGQPGGLGPDTCVGEPDDTFDDFSNYGKVIDIAAPSECILSTVPGGYALSTGTSMASPHVAGAAALIKAVDPSATPAQIRAMLLALAEPGPIPGDPDNFPEGVLNVSAL